MSVETNSEKVIELGSNPPNWGELEQPHGVGHAQSQCGDWVRMTLRLSDDGRIADARFLAHGCMSALASSAALTELAKGKTVDEAARVTNEDVIVLLGGLPEHKSHCSALAYRAYLEAIENCGAESEERLAS